MPARALKSRLTPFFGRLQQTRLRPWSTALAQHSAERLRPSRHGDLPRWEAALAKLPSLPAGAVQLQSPCVGIAPAAQPRPAQRQALIQALDALHPWRKGPFCLHGVHIDAEWRSDWKWQRLADAIAPLSGRLVLDIGCSNGYYGYRALGAGAELVLGIDPALRFVLQFLAIDHYIADPRNAVLPLADADLPADLSGFDTVFSMGVLSHRRDTETHLARLRQCLRPGGELVLETLIVDAPGRRVLVPPGRYAQMRNVHALPSLEMLRVWLAETGFQQIQVVDVTRTTTQEQRPTRWMRFHSLADFLDPVDPGRTIEGHPAPTRAVVIARR